MHSTLILLYHTNGDKYTGIWDDFKGQGDIYYTEGKKYTGQWNYLCGFKRHGLGILYSADGQILKEGKWERNDYRGKE